MVFRKSLYVLLAVLAVHLITAQRPGGRPDGHGGPGGRPGGRGGRDDSGDDVSQDRFRQIVRCNFTEQPGRSCVSCNETLICSRLNLGILNTCRDRRPHCNQGFCSRTPSENCNSTSTA